MVNREPALSNFDAHMSRTLALLALLFSVLLAPAQAAPGAAEPFDAQTWRTLRQQVDASGKPMLVMFTASWCAVCPGVAKQLAADKRRQRAGTPLLMVMSDLSPEELAQHRGHGMHAHAEADRLLAFDGPEAPIRHAVDPRWRGMVPYIAWLAPRRAPEFVSGAPDAATLARWWGR